jgi:hypothetical protein
MKILLMLFAISFMSCNAQPGIGLISVDEMLGFLKRNENVLFFSSDNNNIDLKLRNGRLQIENDPLFIYMNSIGSVCMLEVKSEDENGSFVNGHELFKEHVNCNFGKPEFPMVASRGIHEKLNMLSDTELRMNETLITIDKGIAKEQYLELYIQNLKGETIFGILIRLQQKS